MMMLFNFFSHGTQDLYPTFLQKQHQFDPSTVVWIIIVANIGAIVGGIAFGSLSERIGRVNAITIAADRPAGVAAVGLFLDAGDAGARRVRHADRGAGRLGRRAGASQRIVARRGARHAARLRLSGRQLPRLLQRAVPGEIAKSNGGDYGFALALVGGVVAVALIVVIRFSPEKRGETLQAH